MQTENVVKGRLLSSNVDKIKKIHSEMIGQRVWVTRDKGFVAYVEDVIDEEYFLCRNHDETELKVSCFEIRGMGPESGSRYAA